MNLLEYTNVSSLKGLFISNKWQLIFVCSKTHILIFDLFSKQLKLIFEPNCGASTEDFTNVVVEENSPKGVCDALILSHSGVHNGFIIKLDLSSVLENNQDGSIWKRNLNHIPSGMFLRYNVSHENQTHNFIYSVDFSEILILNSKNSNIVSRIQKGTELSPFSICFEEEEHLVFVCEFVSVSMFHEEGINRWTKIAEFRHPSMLLPSDVLVDQISKQVLVLSGGNMHVYDWKDKRLVKHYNFPIKNPLGAYWIGQSGELFVSDSYSRKIFILK